METEGNKYIYTHTYIYTRTEGNKTCEDETEKRRLIKHIIPLKFLEQLANIYDDNNEFLFLKENNKKNMARKIKINNKTLNLEQRTNSIKGKELLSRRSKTNPDSETYREPPI